MKREWLIVLGGALLAAALLYARYGAQWSYALRLLNAKRIADRFYAEYAAIAKNVPYGPAAAKVLDVYTPEGDEPHPVFVFVHGGSWRDGNKELYAPVAQRLLPSGMVVIIPRYTLYPGATYRGQAREVAAAVAWVLDHIADYGGDPGRVIIGGHSAGAHLTGLVTFDPHYLELAGHSPSELCGWVGISGVYDARAQYGFDRANGRTGALVLAVMEGEENFDRASPAAHLRADAPPVLLIHGDADRTVPVSMATDLDESLKSVGAVSRLLVYPGATHTGILLDALAQDEPRLLSDITAFVRGCAPAEPSP